MATPEALLLLAATTFVAGVVAHMVWQARGWAASASSGRTDGRGHEEGEDSTQLDTFLPSSSSTSSSAAHPSHAYTRRRPSHSSPSHPYLARHDEQETPLGSSLLFSPSPPPPPDPPLPQPNSPSSTTCPEWISKAGATDSWSEAVTGLEEEARDVW